MSTSGAPETDRDLMLEAYQELRRLRAEVVRLQDAKHVPIAVVGMSCRFPGGANSPREFWDVLSKGTDGVGPRPAGREVPAWPAHSPEHPGRSAGYLREVDRFDASFFGISPREASRLDPQQRLLMELIWEALEDAGQDTAPLRGSPTGVFVALYNNDYARLQLADPERADAYVSTGISDAMAAGRIAYHFDLRGPTLVVDTACSSSLVALHLACRSLAAEESELAIVAASNLILDPVVTLLTERLQGSSPTGRCRTFDARADGYVRGEGVGALVLRRLPDARTRRDRIHGVIRSSVINQDGRSLGLTAPNGKAQRELLQQALSHAGVEPREIGYVEAHGTGTPLGDPIEIEALTEVLSTGRSAGERCRIGSVKSNVGHLEASAGLAGVIKVLLSFQAGQLPANLHFQTLNPHIQLDPERFEIVSRATAWPAGSAPRLAGVSSFGLSGTNAHVILEEPPREAPVSVPATERSCVVALSGADEAMLAERARRLLHWLGNEPEGVSASLRDVAFSLGARRSHLDFRLAACVGTKAELTQLLQDFVKGPTPAHAFTGRRPGRQPRLAFVFSGFGGYGAARVKELLAEEPVFREALQRCEAALRQNGAPSVLAILEGSTPGSSVPAIVQTQLAGFALQVALAELWRSWGVTPELVVGHSMGEVAAAVTAGALSLEDAAKLITARARLLGQLSGQGTMALIELAAPEVEQALASLGHKASVAAVNGPTSTVVSGDSEAVEQVVQHFERKAVRCRRMDIDVPAHSARLEGSRRSLEESLRGLTPRASSVPIFSTVTGKRIAGEELSPAYWADNLRQPVRFWPAIEQALESGPIDFIEIGPHPVLLPGLATGLDGVREAKRPALLIPSMRRDESGRRVLLESLARLYASGRDVNWEALQEPGAVLTLPAMPWRKQRFWFDDSTEAQSARPPTERPVESRPSTDQDTVARFYDAIAPLHEGSLHGRDSAPALLTFGLLPQRVPGFSWSLGLFQPDAHPEIHRQLVEAQRALREIAFGSVDLSTVTQALDIGCGYATDLFDLAQRHSQLQLDGFTLSPRQAALAQQRLSAARLDSRVRVRVADSAHTDFPGTYDMAFGFEVAGLVRDKAALFSNIARHLRPGGTLLLADLVANTRSGLEVDTTSTFASARSEWGELLADQRLRLSECVDVSAQVMNFLDDPTDARELRRLAEKRSLDEEAIQALESWANIRRSLERGLLSYVVLIATLDRHASRASVLRTNQERLATASPPSEVSRTAAAPGPASTSSSTPAELLHRIEWQPQERPASPVASAREGAWLLFADAGGVAGRLAARLEAQGQRVVVIRRPPSDARSGDRLREALLDALGPHRTCKGVLFLSGLDAGAAEDGGPEQLSAALDAGALALLPLAQRMATEPLPGTPRLWVLTQRVWDKLPAGQRGTPAQAPLWGLGRTLMHEAPGLQTTLVDLGGSDEDLRALVSELEAPSSEDQLLFRDGRRHVARLHRGELPGEARAGAVMPPVRSDATYLITGGLGGLGLATAGWLSRQGARNLVLLGRTAPSEASARAVEELRKSGARVEVATLDAGERPALEALLTRIDRELPPLRGIFHAAGALADGVVAEMDATRFLVPARAKVHGAWNLHVLTRGRELDFFVLFSSFASLLGSPGQANHAAANSFLDALALHRRGLGLPATSVQWGPWARVGEVASHRKREELLVHQGFSSIEPEQALGALEWLLRHEVSLAGVAAFDFDRWSSRQERLAATPLYSRLRAPVPSTTPAPSEPAASPPPRASIAELALGHIAEVMRIPAAQLNQERSLIEQGLDSLMGVELKNRLELELGVSLPMARLLSNVSLSELLANLSAGAKAPPPKPAGWEEGEL
ncbi:type I polyketide synthase [Hyalangium gracile]|uniref:type I polyketide synthase n=1 Tax=Hyalangium gracile TaxID=394092 RepID=UPI001CCE200B|nr:type I polyketide synthase [Hyalangium gracile]